LSEFNIYLLRHGELVQTGILCGRTDIALSDIGKQQLTNATNKLPKISYCYSSPLIRCRIFAEEYCQQNALSLQVSTQLQEINFGDWDGKSYQELWQTKLNLDENIVTLGDFWQNPWQCLPPNGESMDNFTKRVDDFWQSLLAQLQQTKQEESNSPNTLIFSHGGVIRYLLAKVLKLPIPGTTHMTNLDVPYGALIHIQIFIDNEGKIWPKLKL
jgi:alpha-ribazole phosphatase